ncbi:MAG TPA: cytochrome c biogenesis protein CcdA [Burkholderiales bacterium]|nr:cytochrome c biogenesis protein CcdA [Burkholderiales bacterium]
MTKKLSFLVAGTLLLFGLVFLFRLENIGTTALWNLSDGGTWLLPLIGVAALIDSINPCAFSILLLTIAFLLSIGKLRSGVLAIGSAYILGIFVVYLVIGLGLLQTLHLFDTPHFMAKVGASLLVVLGLINITKEFYPTFPLKLAIPQAAHQKIAVLMEKASVPTAVVLGGLVGLCEFPCTGGPYLMVLGLLHDHATYYTGAAYLVMYNLLFILPLVLILLIASDRTLLSKVQAWQQGERKVMRWGGGLAMVALGMVIFAI